MPQKVRSARLEMRGDRVAFAERQILEFPMRHERHERKSTVDHHARVRARGRNAVHAGRETIERDIAQVESSEINSHGYQVPVVYKLRRVDGTWKIYDEVIGNVSVVNNFRVQFDRITAKSSFEELTKLLREKAEKN